MKISLISSIHPGGMPYLDKSVTLVLGETSVTIPEKAYEALLAQASEKAANDHAKAKGYHDRWIEGQKADFEAFRQLRDVFYEDMGGGMICRRKTSEIDEKALDEAMDACDRLFGLTTK